MKWRLTLLSFWRSLVPDHRVFSVGVGLLGGLALALAAIVAAAASGTYSGLNDDSTLALISVQAQSVTTSSVALTPDQIDRIKGVDHVEDVYPWAQSGLTIEEGNSTAIVWATATAPEMVPTCLTQYPCPLTVDDHSIILPASADGVDLTALAGTDVSFSYEQMVSQQGNAIQGTTKDVTLHVVGLYDPNDAKVDGQAAAFVSLANATAWEAAYKGMTSEQLVATGYDQIFVKADSAENTHAIVAQLTQMGIPSMSYYALTHQMPQAFRLLQSLSLVLGFALLLVCVIVGTSLGSSIALSRRRIVGLLKAVGWTTPQVTRSLTGEVALLGEVVGIVALVVGLVFGWLVDATLGGRVVAGVTVPSSFAFPSLWWLAGCLFGPMLATALGALPRILRTARTPPDEALRDL